MPIELATQYLPYVDELFTTESKKSLVTNNQFSWDGAATIKIYRIGVAPMQDYGRSGPQPGHWSRYGKLDTLDADTQAMTLRNDKSFTFVIDRLDEDETKWMLAGASALARQLREVVIPMVDQWTYQEMCEGAGKVVADELTPENLYKAIIEGSNVLDNAEAPDTGRVLMVTPDTFLLMKQSRDIVLESDVGNNLRLRGVFARLDGMQVVRIPANRLPKDFGFAIAHPCAAVAPTKLASYRIHQDPPGISGSLVEGRLNYDCFILDNKKDAIYVHMMA